MKNYLLFLSVAFFFLLAAGNLSVSFLSQEGMEEECSLHQENMDCSTHSLPISGYVLPVTSEIPDGVILFEDGQSIARQLRVCGRSQRVLTLHYTLLNKDLLFKLAKYRMDALFQSSHVYTTLLCRSWEVSSDHYVFGLRHILI